jgi:hypothetical protein
MSEFPELVRREFIAASAAAGLTIPTGSDAKAESVAAGASRKPAAASAESLVNQLYRSLSEKQRSEICFDWNHVHPRRGRLRTFVAENWNITKPKINDDFYSDQQRELITGIFESIIHPDWHQRYYQQLEDDAGGFGHEQSIGIFGKPNGGENENFELVLTGRHMTLRCNGNSADGVALDGPIFYGHSSDTSKGPNATANVFWNQAVAATKLYQMLSRRQKRDALISMTPLEQEIQFRGQQSIPGLPVSDLSVDQKEHLHAVLGTLVEMYRPNYQTEALTCLREQGALDACSLSFFSDNMISNDQCWNHWRFEGPSFVWHYRAAPHVHSWVNIADNRRS